MAGWLTGWFIWWRHRHQHNSYQNHDLYGPPQGTSVCPRIYAKLIAHSLSIYLHKSLFVLLEQAPFLMCSWKIQMHRSSRSESPWTNFQSTPTSTDEAFINANGGISWLGGVLLWRHETNKKGPHLSHFHLIACPPQNHEIIIATLQHDEHKISGKSDPVKGDVNSNTHLLDWTNAQYT